MTYPAIPYMVPAVEASSAKAKVLGSLKKFMSANNQLNLAMKQMYLIACQAKTSDE